MNEASKMNPEIKAKWVKALRSGEYKQETGALRKNDGFCCLGVLCDLHAREFDEGWKHHTNEYLGECEKYEYQGQRNYLSPPVMQWAGLDSISPGVYLEKSDSLHTGPVLQSLDLWNDSGKTFEQIAEAIEEQL